MSAPTVLAVTFGSSPITIQETSLLTGYRFFDSAAIQSAFRITNQVVIRPGESIVFADNLSRDEFSAWWGATNLPADLQVISYSRVGFREYETLFLWNAAAQAADENVVSTSWGSNQCVGVSIRFSSDSRDTYCHTNGEFGAFRSALGGNIGSPGYDAIPRIIATYIVENRVVMRCLGRPSEHYELQRSDSLVDADWRTVAVITAPGFHVRNYQ
jgi:hypothetical protein